MNYELGQVKQHPLVYAFKEFWSVIQTWRYCRKNNLPCDIWYGVYEKGTENVIAKCGPLPGAYERARNIRDMLEGQNREMADIQKWAADKVGGLK